MMDSKGFAYKSEKGNLKVMKGSLVVLKGKLQHGMYILQGIVISSDAAVLTNKTDKTLIWHKRLRHIGMKGKQGVIDPKKISALDICEACIFGKSHRLKFSHATYKTKGILEYVHLDLWGSSKVPFSLSNFKYFISFIDDFSRKVWTSFLKTKDQAFEKFREWKHLLEHQTGKKI